MGIHYIKVFFTSCVFLSNISLRHWRKNIVMAIAAITMFVVWIKFIELSWIKRFQITQLFWKLNVLSKITLTEHNGSSLWTNGEYVRDYDTDCQYRRDNSCMYDGNDKDDCDDDNDIDGENNTLNLPFCCLFIGCHSSCCICWQSSMLLINVACDQYRYYC